MKKSATIAVLLIAMVLTSCADNANPGTQTAETTTSVPEVTTTLADTTEVTSDVETEFSTMDELIGNSTVYVTDISGEGIEKLFNSLDSKAKEGVLEKEFVIRFSDADDILFLISLGGYTGNSYVTFDIEKILCKGQLVDSSIDFAYGPYSTDIIITDSITAIGVSMTGEYYLFDDVSNGKIDSASGKDQASYRLFEKDGELFYSAQHPISADSYGDPIAVLSELTDFDTWEYEQGRVSYNEGTVIFNPEEVKSFSEKESDFRELFNRINEDEDYPTYPSEHANKIRKFKTIEELMEYNKIN